MKGSIIFSVVLVLLILKSRICIGQSFAFKLQQLNGFVNTIYTDTTRLREESETLKSEIDQLREILYEKQINEAELEKRVALLTNESTVCQSQVRTLSRELRMVKSGLTAEKGRLHQVEEDLNEWKHNVPQPQGELPKTPLPTKCESGIIYSDYCYPYFSPSCFNKRKSAEFALSFNEPPAVSVGLIHMDVSNESYIRVSVDYPGKPIIVSKEGLSVKFTCWRGTKCFKAHVSWIACGPVEIGN